MGEQLDLGAFLAQQSAAGEIDSKGDFTVSHHEAVKKLARFALPRQHAWVCKLVQAAVRWGCFRLHLKQSRTETQFHLRFSQTKDIPDEDAIVAGLVSGRISGPEAIDSLAMALRALVEQAKLSFVLVTDSGKRVPRPIYAGYHYGQISEVQRLSPRFRPGPGLTLTVYHHRPYKEGPKDVWDLLPPVHRGDIPIARELDHFAYVCPFPLSIDGRLVDGLLHASAMKFSQNHVPLVQGALVGLENSPPRLRLPSDFEEKVLSITTHPKRASRTYGGRKEAAAAFLLTYYVPADSRMPLALPHKRSHLHWVADGVIVESELLDVESSDVGMHIYANAAGLATDLTGFTTLANEERARRRAEILKAVGTRLQEPQFREVDFFRDDLDHLSPVDQQADLAETQQKRKKIMLGGSGTGLALTLVNPVLGVSTTVAALVGGYKAGLGRVDRESVLKRRNILERRLLADIDGLRKALLGFLSDLDGDISFDDDSESPGG